MTATALLTDFYELTMIQGYFLHNKNPEVVFDMFFRKQPFSGGFSVFAGLNDLLTILQDLHFSNEDIDYLKSLGRFDKRFLSYLSDFRFTGTVHAMEEGSIIFPGEPIIRVQGPLIDTQVIESVLLNCINFQTLIATKAARIFTASKRGKILEFGLRRAQGYDGSLTAARAAYIGGASATSNTLAGRLYGIPVSGTMAHSWVMAFESELESFEKFAEVYPDNSILLIDTYDTLGSGIENAIKVGLKMKEKGKTIGVRLDSGDLSYLSSKIRYRLDTAGLNDVKITVSNDLNEEIINQLISDQAPIDLWGVGTHLVTGGSEASLTGVYKLAARESNGVMQPTLKVSNNIEKTTNPGVKQVYRFYDSDGFSLADLISLEEEEFQSGKDITFHHPILENTSFVMKGNQVMKMEAMLTCKMKGGKILGTSPTLTEIRENVIKNLALLDKSYQRLINPHRYKVSLSKKLKLLKSQMVKTPVC